MRKTVYDQNVVQLITPWEFLRRSPTQQVAKPSPSSWGEEGYWKVWLNDHNQWIYPHLDIAAGRMEELVATFPTATGLTERALKQVARELLLAQSSDWPFIMRTGTSPDYARQRIKDHILRFTQLYDQLKARRIDEPTLTSLESTDNIFADINYRSWSR